MLRKLREARDEEGFTLIELLVVVLIIGILAAIAIPVFLNQREKAYEDAVQSDLRNRSIQIESDYQDATDTNADGQIGYNDLFAVGDTLPASTDVTLTVASVVVDGYCVNGTHARIGAAGPHYHFEVLGTADLAEVESGGC